MVQAVGRRAGIASVSNLSSTGKSAEVTGDYTTQGEEVIYVRTSQGAITITLSTADVRSGQVIEIVDVDENASSNNITVDTEGSATIDPGAASSKTLNVDGVQMEFESEGTDWFAPLNEQRESTTTEKLDNAYDDFVTTDEDLQTAIDDASNGDHIRLGRGTHTVTGALTSDKRLTITGPQLNVAGAKWSNDTADALLRAWDGAVIEQQTGGANVLHHGQNEEAQQVVLKHILLTWKSFLRDSDTGHGVVFDAPEDSGGPHKLNGVYQWLMENIAVIGHDGDSYGFKMINSLQGLANKVQTYGGGGWHWVEDHAGTNMGNAVIVDSYSRWDNVSTNHGIKLETNNGVLNFITWVRPQVNASIGGSGGKHLKETNNGADIKGMTWLGVDFEGGSDGIDMSRGKGHTWLPAAVTDSLYGSGMEVEIVHIPEKNLEIHTDYVEVPQLKTHNKVEMGAPNEENRAIEYKHDFGAADEEVQTEIQFAKYTTKLKDLSGRNVPFIYEDTDASVERFRVGGNSGLTVEQQDLSGLTLGSDEDGRLYYHNGASSISADGGTTSTEGWYMWDNSASEFKSVVQH